MLLKLTGVSVEIMYCINPEYKQHIVDENGKIVLYVLVIRSIYGCIEYALLWYDLYTHRLKQMVFVLNKYDPCVTTYEIEGKQCAILWHMDDNKVAHIDVEVVTNVTQELERHFGNCTVTRGK